MAHPTHRMSYYCKETKRSFDVAAIFANDRHDWKQDVAPERQADMNAQYPKMLLSEAAARAERKEGYLSITRPKQQGQGQQRSPEQRSGGTSYDRAPLPAGDDFGGGGGEFSDDSIPFMRASKGIAQ